MSIDKLIKKNVRLIIPGFHFLLTFLFERLIFIFSWDNIGFLAAEPMNNYISYKGEMVITYIIIHWFCSKKSYIIPGKYKY